MLFLSDERTVETHLKPESEARRLGVSLVILEDDDRWSREGGLTFVLS